MMLGDKLHGKNERLNGLKFIAAAMVIFSHAFSLNGYDGKEWLNAITFGQIGFGSLAVGIFFFVSGLLVTKKYCGKSANKISGIFQRTLY